MFMIEIVKAFDFSPTFIPPNELNFQDIIATPLSRKDLYDDLQGVNSSIKLIQDTRGGSWPTGALAEDFDFLDLAWHEREFREMSSFAYVLRDKLDAYIGCFYIYPMGVRTVISTKNDIFDADVSWWVTKEAYNQGYYEKVYKALQIWIPDSFPFNQIFYSNKLIPN